MVTSKCGVGDDTRKMEVTEADVYDLLTSYGSDLSDTNPNANMTPKSRKALSELFWSLRERDKGLGVPFEIENPDMSLFR